IGVVVPAIAAFTKRYPACKVDAVLSDQTLDLMSGNIEMAIRVGWLTETSEQTRKIGSFRQLLVTSSSMARQMTGLERPEEIADLPFVANTALRDYLRWSFSSDDGEHRVVPRWRLPSGGIHAVFPAARYRPAKVRAFVDLLVERNGLRGGTEHP
ncbi:MAG: LysR family transcriptional regulator, partial [Bradyrhizobium sp.]|nr:LysR family transcriptional regulator [Bradyrhizobium sp.]